MTTIKINQDPRVKAKFQSYPDGVKQKLERLRAFILEVASEIDEIYEIHETLKWGEPSYLVKKGSTIRMDWKSKTPDKYAMYFNCNTRLVETFKALYGDLFDYEKNRAITFDLEGDVPVIPLKQCIALALEYHTLKDQPLLGQ